MLGRLLQQHANAPQPWVTLRECWVSSVSIRSRLARARTP